MVMDYGTTRPGERTRPACCRRRHADGSVPTDIKLEDGRWEMGDGNSRSHHFPSATCYRPSSHLPLVLWSRGLYPARFALYAGHCAPIATLFPVLLLER